MDEVLILHRTVGQTHDASGIHTTRLCFHDPLTGVSNKSYLHTIKHTKQTISMTPPCVPTFPT